MKTKTFVFAALLCAYGLQAQTVTVSGQLKRWHTVALTIDGPFTNEQATPNPFLDYRLNVAFVNGSTRFVVPGYYAADGNAAETSATSGNKWRVDFVPDRTGTWQYEVSFRQGAGIAVNTAAGAGVSPDGARGSFIVSESDKNGRDLRSKGFLVYAGKRYYEFSGTREPFLKGGANSPENLLAFADFDDTSAKHHYKPHSKDWKSGDPSWKGGKGKSLIGALNYLAHQGMNSAHALTMTVGGDGKDVWPWTSQTQRLRYDVSKLAQWEAVFSHMDRLGLALHLTTQERENDTLLDKGALGPERKLYLRELVARFGHHLGVVWNIGEENSNTDVVRRQIAEYIEELDPYRHPVVIHNFPTEDDTMFGRLVGNAHLDGSSIQVSRAPSAHARTTEWLTKSTQAGRPWVVTVDEIGPASAGVKPDSTDPDHDEPRKHALWGNLMAGGAGVEWYFGYNYQHDDLDAEDWRSRHNMWTQTRHALDFFREYLPFPSMTNCNSLTSASSDFCLGSAGQVYAIYLPEGGTTNLDLGASNASFSVQWFNPRKGGGLHKGSVSEIRGPGTHSIGTPHKDKDKDKDKDKEKDNDDWVALLRNDGSTSTFKLSVTKGTGDGQYTPGARITVTANRAPEGQVFDQWMGSVEHLSSAYASPATFTMPAAAATLTATYKSAGTGGPTVPTGMAVTGLVLLNADTGEPIPGFTPLVDGARVIYSKLPTRNLNVRAITNPPTVGSVVFEVNSKRFRVENVAPYALAGDTENGYLDWKPAPGTYDIQAVPYSGTSGRGSTGTAKTIRITILE